MATGAGPHSALRVANLFADAFAQGLGSMEVYGAYTAQGLQFGVEVRLLVNGRRSCANWIDNFVCCVLLFPLLVIEPDSVLG